MTILAGKTILVMGVANKRSIGWGVALRAAQFGAKLAFTYNSDRAGEQIHKLLADEDITATVVHCNVTDDNSIESAFAKLGSELGSIDGVVHSIAHANVEDLQGEYVATSREGYLLAQNISAYSLVASARAARPLMQTGGSIVTMSYLGGERAVDNYNVMGVAKAALESSVRYLAKDLGKEQIRVNAISAGPIRTLAAKGVRGFNDVLHAMEEKAPLKRNVDAKEVGDVTAFLLSDLSTGMTGEVLHVDGGYHIIGL